MKEHILLSQKMLKCFRIRLNIHNFFEIFEVFRTKVFRLVSYSYVMRIIRLLIKLLRFIQNNRTVINSYEAYFNEKPSTYYM